MAQPGRGPTLLLVNQHYHPDVASTGQHLTDLAEFLAADGFSVEVLTGRAHYVDGVLRVPAREERNGVRIRRVRSTAFGRGSHAGRLADYATFCGHTLFRLLTRRRRYDGVIFLTTPPLLSVLGWLGRALRGQRYAIWSMDLHPDAEVASGMLAADGLAARLLHWANNLGYRRADFIIDLGAYMKRRLVAKGVAPRRTHTVHIWSRREEIEPTSRAANPLIDELGLRDKFVVMYSGNAGIVHEFDAILAAMRALRDDRRIHFLFVGGGPQRARIERFAADHRLSNFAYRGYFPRERLRYSLSVGDAHLISLREPYVGLAVPGKLYGIMAAGRPTIFVGPARCETADAVREADCGVVIDPADGDAAAAIVRTLHEWAVRPELRAGLGERARRTFLERYEREPNCRRFAATIRHYWGAALAQPTDARSDGPLERDAAATA